MRWFGEILSGSIPKSPGPFVLLRFLGLRCFLFNLSFLFFLGGGVCFCSELAFLFEV